jgi:putative transposase
MIREDAAMPVSRFCVLLGIPRRTYCRMQTRRRSGQPMAKGPWPSPAVDMVEKLLEEYLLEHPDHGHRRIHAALLADGHATSPSTVLRAIQRLSERSSGSSS